MIVTTREIDAPRELVFDAFTDPEHLAHWWGPNGFSTTTSAFDMRPGGVWRFVMHGPVGRDYQNRITYDEITRPERITYRHGGGGDVEPVQFRTVITFDDLGGRTRVTLAAEFPSAAERDRVIRDYGADEGGRQTLGRLAQFIADDLFVFSRTFDAPRALVWEVWTDAKHLAKWWGPKGFAWISGTLDLRPGGAFHYGMKSPDGNEMWGRFVFHEIVPPERLIFVNSFSNAEGGIARAPFATDWPLEVLNTLTLAEVDGRTTLTMKGAPIHASQAERAKFRSFKPSMQQGWGGTMDQLEAYLATRK
jgi:uncharacterized protein YndB with AHSA1/START domain